MTKGLFEPWLTYSAILWLTGLVQPEHRVFEWGAGGSTIWFARNAREILSVESDLGWYRRVSAWLANFHLTNAELRFEEETQDWVAYADQLTPGFDVILIDGHLDSRAQCALKTVQVADPESVVILDNSDRLPNAAKLLSEWCDESVTFWGPGRKGQRWATTFYYGKAESRQSNN